MVVWDGLRKLNGYQGSDVRCLNRCVMETICQRNLPELNIAVLVVKAIYFMPGDLGSRTLRIACPSNGVPLGSRTLGSTWDRVHLGSSTLRMAYPSYGVVSLGSRTLGIAYPSTASPWDGVPLGWRALGMACPSNGVPFGWRTLRMAYIPLGWRERTSCQTRILAKETCKVHNIAVLMAKPVYFISGTLEWSERARRQTTLLAKETCQNPRTSLF